MTNHNQTQTSRRQFMTKIVPTCALTCLGSKALFGMLRSESNQEAKHKFDQSFGELTFRQVSEMQSRVTIEILQELEQVMGKNNLIKFLKEFSTKKLTERGKLQASQMPNNDLQSYVSQFKHQELYKKAMTFEIVEDTETVFEMKVSECLSASTFLAKGAGDIGHALICWGDFAWAKGFNPKIKLIRDKTLMQGHHCCNHRYVWEG